jgi:uridine kinase
MVLGTREIQKIFSAVLPITPERAVYVLPLVLLVLFYWTWRIRRLDFLMLWTFTGLAWFAIILLTTAAPGWMMWLMPFLVTTPIRRQLIYRMVQAVLALSFIAIQLLSSTGALLISGLDLTGPMLVDASGITEHAIPILETMLFASGGILAVQFARAGILQRSYYLGSRKPYSIGVAGDSGAGKDTLVDAVQGLFEDDETTRLAGDDYHRWDRQGPMWRAITHLHPQANDLESFTNHALALSDGRNVIVRHYDHGSGRYDKRTRVDARQFVLVQGLHALWASALVDRYDLRIFMDMDEDLRRFVKMQRDVTVRGHAPEKVLQSFERRQPDRERFILPQMDNASTVFRLEPRHVSAIADIQRPLQPSQLRLVITLRRGVDFDLPARLLTALCGVHVVAIPLTDGRVRITVDGEPTAEDIAAVARRLVPGMMIYLANDPQWRGGMTGVMQLAVLYELDAVRRKRELAA